MYSNSYSIFWSRPFCFLTICSTAYLISAISNFYFCITRKKLSHTRVRKATHTSPEQKRPSSWYKCLIRLCRDRRNQEMQKESKHPGRWTESQRQLAELLLIRFPKLKKAYDLGIALGDIFNKCKDKKIAFTKLGLWHNQVGSSRILSFESVARSILRQ